MKILNLIVGTILSGAIAQGATQRVLDGALSPIFSLPSEYQSLSVEGIYIADVPTRIEFDDSCDYETSCGPYRVLESVRAVQIRFYYVDLNGFSENGPDSVEVNLPVASFSSTELAQIQKASDYVFDLTGKKTRQLKALANQLIKVEVTSVMEPIEVIDYEKSDCTYVGDFEGEVCENPIYKTVHVKKNTALVSHK